MTPELWIHIIVGLSCALIGFALGAYWVYKIATAPIGPFK